MNQNITIIKFIAIIMMIIHHFLGFPQWLDNANELINIPGISSFRVWLALQCKLCVALYAFVTGYSIYKGRRKYTIKYILIKLLKLFSIYWVCNLAILAIGLLFHEPMPSFSQLLLTAFGLGVEIDVPYVNNPFAWYVFCYIVIVTSIPAISDLLDGRDVLKGIIILGTEIVLIGSIEKFIVSDIFRTESYINYLLVAIAGSVCAKYNIYNRIQFKLLKKCSGILKIMLFFLVTLLILGIRKVSPFFIDYFLAPVYLFAIINIDLNSIVDNKICVKNIITCFAQYSTPIWFLQAVFFTPNRSVQSVLYWSHVGVIVVLWGSAVLLLGAIICVYLSNRLLAILRIRSL